MAISQDELKTALQTLLSTVKFRLRGRRGTTAQLDPSLMKAGEFAFCTDTRTLYACYVDGVIEQVSHGFIPKATYGTLAALQAAHPTGVASDYYMVGTGPYHLYNWGGAAWDDMGAWNDMSLYATQAATSVLESQITSLASGSPKGTYATTALLATAFPTGNTNIYVVTADGGWYYWSGAVWTSGGTYQATGIADESVAMSKLGTDVNRRLVDLISLSENINISSNLDPLDYYDIIDDETNVTIKIKAYQFGNYRWEVFYINDKLAINDYIFTIKNYSNLGVYVIVGETIGHYIAVSSLNGGVLLLSKTDNGYVVISNTGATTGTWENIYDIPFKISYVGNIITFTNQNNTNDIRTLDFSLMNDMSSYMASLILGYLGFAHNEAGAYYPLDVDFVTFYPSSKICVPTITVITDRVGRLESSVIENSWKDKIWYAFGTSLTNIASEGKYPIYLASLSGMILTNYGVSGGAINDDILAMIKATVLTGAEVITLEGFVNDWYLATPLGVVGDTTATTYAGAIYDALTYIMQNSSATVVCITDHTGRLYNAIDISTSMTNGLGLKQIDYTDMFVRVCNYLSVPIINAGQKSMVNEFTASLYLSDQIHLNDLGGEQFANTIWDEMINMHPSILS